MSTKRIILSMCFFVISCSMCMNVEASNFKVTAYPDFSGNVKQIWIEAENYDLKSDEFVEDAAVSGASGQALYCPTYSPTADIQQWWMEYSIDSLDTQINAADLTGTWYCWVRVNQPSANAEEADYLLVKGDPNDGSGQTWYSAALGAIDDAKDRISNDISGLAGAGVGVWGWLGEAGSGVAKQFNVDEAGKIVFRINEREGGEGNGRIDVICWTNDPSYKPSDADFYGSYVTNGLVLDYNAAQAGKNVNDYAKPLVGNGTGILRTLNEGALTGTKPVIVREDASDGKYNWFYRFDSATISTVNNGAGGYIGDLDPAQALNFDLNDSFTVEVWFRVPNLQPCRSSDAERGVIVGNSYSNDTGWRVTVRDNGTNSKYFVKLFLRDSYNDPAIDGDDRWAPGNIRNTPATELEYSNEFHHAVFTVLGSDATGTNSIKFTVYLDGQYNSGGTLTTSLPISSYSIVDSRSYVAIGNSYDPYPISGDGAVGKMPFDGDIAVVRIYNRVLSSAEAIRNYTAGFASDVSVQCGGVEYDLNGDCTVNNEDLALLALDWLNCQTVPQESCN